MTTDTLPATEQPPRFAVEFLDLPADEESQRASADSFTGALACVATARGAHLSGTVTEYDTAARRFLVWLDGATSPAACVRDLRPVRFA